MDYSCWNTHTYIAPTPSPKRNTQSCWGTIHTVQSSPIQSNPVQSSPKQNTQLVPQICCLHMAPCAHKTCTFQLDQNVVLCSINCSFSASYTHFRAVSPLESSCTIALATWQSSCTIAPAPWKSSCTMAPASWCGFHRAAPLCRDVVICADSRGSRNTTGSRGIRNPVLYPALVKTFVPPSVIHSTIFNTYRTVLLQCSHCRLTYPYHFSYTTPTLTLPQP